ncbi:MAG TPA: hypothetical protein VFN68_05565 [Acidimicrobiales bacterium]|nr:hypothetical protein [Acidimicrobiales bacterium]
MLLLVTLALVVASAVLLILGFVQDTLGYIYLSMLCAGVAALALIVFARLARRRSAALVGAGIAADQQAARPAGPDGAAGPERDSDEVGGPAPADPDPDADTAGHPVLVAGADGTGPATDRAAGPADPGEAWPGEDWSDWGEEVVFPIEGYDGLRVAEILPLLTRLEPAQLQEVRDREVSGKARATILDRIDERLDRAGRPTRAAGGRSRPAGAAPRPARGASPGDGDADGTGPASPAPAKRTRKRASTPTAPSDPVEPAAPARKASPRKAAGRNAPARKGPAPGGPAADAGDGPDPGEAV